MPATDKGGIAAALLEVQKNAPDLHKDATNPHFNSKFVSLDTVLTTVRPILNENDVVVRQHPTYDTDSGQPVLRTKLTHVPSGEVEESDMLLFAPKQDPQGQGSAITYARRYALLSILGLTADEDDDGNAGTKAKQGERKLKDVSDKELEDATGGKILLTADQRKRFKTAQTHLEWSDDDMAAWLKDEAGPDATLDNLGKGDGDVLLRALRDKVRDLREAAKAAA